MRKVSHDNQLLSAMVKRLKQNFAEHNRWCQRQMFAHLCQCILEDKSLSAERFASELLPELLKLHADPIPNVRVSVARVIAYQILKSGEC
jgi:serine/threonine-protein phosphatase 4 regulatory subunit 1